MCVTHKAGFGMWSFAQVDFPHPGLPSSRMDWSPEKSPAKSSSSWHIVPSLAHPSRIVACETRTVFHIASAYPYPSRCPTQWLIQDS